MTIVTVRNPCFSGVLVALAVYATAADAAPKPQISIRSKAAAITVSIDGALRAHPGLAEDCLAEGRRWANRTRAESDKTRVEEPEFFAKGRRWTFDRTYRQRSVVGRFVSVVRDDDTYTGGAHPNTRTNTILWDRVARKRVSVRPFFGETADNGPTLTAIARLARIAIATEKLARDAINVDVPKGKLTPERLAALDDFIVQGISPTLLKLGPITLAPSTVPGRSSGLTLHYSPYDVGAYAEGPYTAFVPWTSFRQFLSPEGRAIFGGERPQSDKNP
jgi:hypothetical protein